MTLAVTMTALSGVLVFVGNFPGFSDITNPLALCSNYAALVSNSTTFNILNSPNVTSILNGTTIPTLCTNQNTALRNMLPQLLKFTQLLKLFQPFVALPGFDPTLRALVQALSPLTNMSANDTMNILQTVQRPNVFGAIVGLSTTETQVLIKAAIGNVLGKLQDLLELAAVPDLDPDLKALVQLLDVFEGMNASNSDQLLEILMRPRITAVLMKLVNQTIYSQLQDAKAKFLAPEYMFNTAPKSWPDAEAACVQWGGHLATISSQSQQDYLASKLSLRGTWYWIGLNDHDHEGTFVWVKPYGEIGYRNWIPRREPNHDGDCVMMMVYWGDYPCSAAYPYVCQKLAPTSTRTTEITTAIKTTAPASTTSPTIHRPTSTRATEITTAMKTTARAPTASPTIQSSFYKCMDGEQALVHSTRDGYYCSARINGPNTYANEQHIIDACNNDTQCTGYDYRGTGGVGSRYYGHLCMQTEYPGSSKTCCGYKLCKKSAPTSTSATEITTAMKTTARTPTAPPTIQTPTEPRNLQADGGSQRIHLTWAEPQPTNGKIQHYHACYIMTHDDGEAKIGEEMCETITPPKPLEVWFDGLGKFSTYNVSVTAENSAANGTVARKSDITTSEEIPTKVQHVTADGVTVDNQITVKWDQPEHIYGILFGYTVYINSTAVDSCTNIRMFQCVIRGLPSNILYMIAVKVRNRKYTSKTVTKQVKTNPTVPPAPPLPPSPRDSGIKKNSFVINLVKFDEKNGPIAHYDVIVWPRGDRTSKPTVSPAAFSNKDISDGNFGLYIAGRIYEYVTTFSVGSGSISKRKRRALGIPDNRALEAGTNYAVFVRGYVSDNVYRSTEWYPVVKTIPGTGFETWGIIVIVLVVLVIILMGIIVGFMYSKKRRNNPAVEKNGLSVPSVISEQPNAAFGVDATDENNVNYSEAYQLIHIYQEIPAELSGVTNVSPEYVNKPRPRDGIVLSGGNNGTRDYVNVPRPEVTGMNITAGAYEEPTVSVVDNSDGYDTVVTNQHSEVPDAHPSGVRSSSSDNEDDYEDYVISEHSEAPVGVV